MADAGDECIERGFRHDECDGVLVQEFMADENGVVVVEKSLLAEIWANEASSVLGALRTRLDLKNSVVDGEKGENATGPFNRRQFWVVMRSSTCTGAGASVVKGQNGGWRVSKWCRARVQKWVIFEGEGDWGHDGAIRDGIQSSE
jgi:hypothetical protein